MQTPLPHPSTYPLPFHALTLNAAKAVVPCQNKIILKNCRPEPTVDRPKIILFQDGTTSEMK